MEYHDKINEEINKIKKNSIIGIECVSCFSLPGYTIVGTLITKDKKIYTYRYYSDTPKQLEEKDANYIYESKELSNDEYDKVEKFIEGEVIDKEFDYDRIFDVSYCVMVNYNGIEREIRNNVGSEDDPKLYYKVKLFIEEFLKEN